MRSKGGLDVSVHIIRNDELGIVTGMFNQMVSRLKENQATLEQLATTDSLTELANRKQIMADLAINIDQYRRYRLEFSILMIDIDYFKTVNDNYGHLIGDASQLAKLEDFALLPMYTKNKNCYVEIFKHLFFILINIVSGFTI